VSRFADVQELAMQTFTHPQHDAEDAAEAIRRLAHSTRAFADVSDTYWVLTDLAATVRRLEQVAIQVATAHRENLDLAHDDHGWSAGGYVKAVTAAAHLRRAAELFNRAHTSLDLAMRHSGGIAWYDPASSALAAVRTGHDAERRAARTKRASAAARPANGTRSQR
jgi:hypothetical protein